MNTPTCAQAVTAEVTAKRFVPQLPAYHQPPRRVNPPRQVFPGRPDRRPPMKATPAPVSRPASGDGASLGLLLLLLSISASSLNPNEARAGWALAEKWAGAYIESRHTEGRW